MRARSLRLNFGNNVLRLDWRLALYLGGWGLNNAPNEVKSHLKPCQLAPNWQHSPVGIKWRWRRRYGALAASHLAPTEMKWPKNRYISIFLGLFGWHPYLSSLSPRLTMLRDAQEQYRRLPFMYQHEMSSFHSFNDNLMRFNEWFHLANEIVH